MTPARSTWPAGQASIGGVGISPQQFEQLRARVSAPRRRAEPVVGASPDIPRRHQVILGIDPSLRGTGWGVIRTGERSSEATALGYDTVRCPAGWVRSQCLVRIAAALREAIKRHSPTACVVEGLFFAQNLQTALIMGEARGVCMLAAAEAGLELHEIAPRKVKQAIVGFGGAQKDAVARMVQRLLALAAPPDNDAADALALALALAHAAESRHFNLAPRRKL